MKTISSLLLVLLFSIDLFAFSVQGHRGARKIYPENTLPAFAYAIAVGADMIELDIHITKDGVAVIAHDPVVNSAICLRNGKPFTEKLPILSLTLQQIKEFDCGSLRHDGMPKNLVPGAQIPTFDEVIELVKSTPGAEHVGFKVDIKSEDNPKHYLKQAEIARKVLERTWVYGIQDRCIYSSFDVKLLKELRKQDPTSKVSYLITGFATDDIVDTARELQAHTVSPHWLAFSLEPPKWIVQRLHEEGFQVVPWTVNSKSRWKEFIEAGVDGIITDDPEGLINTVGL